MDAREVAQGGLVTRHTCHADTCETPVPPHMNMCGAHWYQIPKPLRDAIWATYRPGQEVDKRPSADYMDVQRAARRALLEKQAARGCADPGEGGCVGTRCESCRARELLR